MLSWDSQFKYWTKTTTTCPDHYFSALSQDQPRAQTLLRGHPDLGSGSFKRRHLASIFTFNERNSTIDIWKGGPVFILHELTYTANTTSKRGRILPSFPCEDNGLTVCSTLKYRITTDAVDSFQKVFQHSRNIIRNRLPSRRSSEARIHHHRRPYLAN